MPENITKEKREAKALEKAKKLLEEKGLLDKPDLSKMGVQIVKEF